MLADLPGIEILGLTRTLTEPECARDRDALLLAARELVGILRRALL